MDAKTREYCQAVIEMLGDNVDADFGTAASFAKGIAQTLGIRLTDNPEDMVNPGLADPRTRDDALRVVQELVDGRATQNASIRMCSALGHEFAPDEATGSSVCTICHVREEEAPDLGFDEGIDEDFQDWVRANPDLHDEIRMRCEVVIDVLREEAEECFEVGERYVDQVAVTLELPFTRDTSAYERIVKRGLDDPRTQAVALKAHREFSEGDALDYAFVMFCTALGHQFVKADYSDIRYCEVCGIKEGEEPELGFEGEDEEANG